MHDDTSDAGMPGDIEAATVEDREDYHSGLSSGLHYTALTQLGAMCDMATVVRKLELQSMELAMQVRNNDSQVAERAASYHDACQMQAYVEKFYEKWAGRPKNEPVTLAL